MPPPSNSSSSSSSPAEGVGAGTDSAQGSNGNGFSASSNGQDLNGNGNKNRNGGRPVSALAAALVGVGGSSSSSHSGHRGHNGHNGNAQPHSHSHSHSHSHVVQSQPHWHPHPHPHPPYPYPQQPVQSAQQHYAHLAAVAAAAAAAAAASASSSSSSSSSSTRSRRSAPKTAAAQSTNTQLPQPTMPAIPKPIRRGTHNPNVPRAEWTSDRDQMLFDVLATVEAAKPPSEKGSWSTKHWASVAQALTEREIPGNGQQRYAVLRREWRTLCELLKKPGFAWDKEEGRVVATEGVWEAHMNSLSVPFHKVAAARLRDKPYPHYDRAKALWGLVVKEGPPDVIPTVHPSAALAAASRTSAAFAINNSNCRPHTPESPQTAIAPYNEGSVPPGAVAAASAAGDSSSSSHHGHRQQLTPERPSAPTAAAAGMHHQHQHHQLQHHSDLDFLRSPSRDDSILSAQELSELMGSVPTPTRSESMVHSPALHFDPTSGQQPPPTSQHASFIPPPLIPYPLGSPTLTTAHATSANLRKRHALHPPPLPPPPPTASASHPHATYPRAIAPKRHKPDVAPPPPFPYQPNMPHAPHAHAHAVYAQPALPLHASDPVYRAVSAAAALVTASTTTSSSSSSAPGAPAPAPDSPLDDLAPPSRRLSSASSTAALSTAVLAPPGAPPSLADSMALAMAWLAGQRAAAGGVDAALMLSAAHVFMEDERVLYMFLALPEDLRVVFLRQRVEAGGEGASVGGGGAEGQV